SHIYGATTSDSIRSDRLIAGCCPSIALTPEKRRAISKRIKGGSSMVVRDLETPALVIDQTILEENLKCMDGLLAAPGLKLRPHYTRHKSPTIAKMELDHGACGINWSKLLEAEDLVKARVSDILIANQVVQPAKISRLAYLAGRCRLTVCVEQEENIRALSEAAALAGTQIHCYVELDVGMKRCGVTTFEEFYRLAALLQKV